MALTRVDTEKLRLATEDLRASLIRLRAVLAPILIVDLTEEERAETLRPSLRILDACRDTAKNAGEFPKLLAVTGYVPAAVTEDLDNVLLLAGLSESLDEFKQWVDDSRLVWGSEAYQQTLSLYNTGKTLVKSDGSYRPLIEPLADVFASRRRKKKEE